MRLISFSALATVSLIALVTPAMAQNAKPASAEDDPAAAEQGSGVGGDIIVTARRREETLLTVPQTVAAVTGKALQEYNLTKFEDISKLVPGLNLTSDNSGFNSSASARGVTFQVSSQGTPTIETYINEVPVEPNLMFQAQFDVAQIEALKGPQGTQRGRSAPSGAITVTTRRPDLTEIGGAISTQVTNHHGVNVQGAINAPIVKDVLGVRIAGIYDLNDAGGIRSVNRSDRPYGRTWGIRGSVRFEPTDNFKVNVMGQRLERTLFTFGQGQAVFGSGAAGVNTAAKSGFLSDDLTIANTTASPNQPCANPGVGTCAILNGGTPQIVAASKFNGSTIGIYDDLTIADTPSVVDQKFDVVSAAFDWGFAGQKLSYVFGYNKVTLDAQQTAPADVSNTIIGRESRYANTFSINQRITSELRLSSDERLLGFLDYTLGLYYGKETGTTNSPTVTSFAGTFGSPLGTLAAGGPGILQPTTYDARYSTVGNRESVRRNIEKAVFATINGHFFDDKLELEAGARQLWYSASKSQVTNFTDGLIAVRNPNGTGACPATLSGTTGSVNFIDRPVVGSTYAGTCDVDLTVGTNTGINRSLTDQPYGTRSWAPIVYRFAASYKITPDFMIYANYGTSWRAGPGPITGAPNCASGQTVGYPNPGLCDAYNLLEPENAKGFEVGFKGSAFDRKLTFSVAAYKQKYDGFFIFAQANPGVYLSGQCVYPNIVGTTIQPNGCTVTSGTFTYNAPVDAKGVDFDFNFRVNNNFTFGGAASWSDSKFDGNAKLPCNDTNFDGQPDAGVASNITAQQYLNAAAGNVAGAQSPASAYGPALCLAANVPGLKPNTTPKWNFNLRAEYTHDISERESAFARALFNYTPANINLNPVNTYIPRAYGVVNVFAGVRAKNGSWELTAAVRNLLNNREVISQGFTGQTLTRPATSNTGEQLSFAPSGNLSGYTTVSLVPPREFQLSLRYAFGSR